MASVAYLTQVLFRNKYITAISVIVVCLSNLAGLNLSRFGIGYAYQLSKPLPYGYAHALRFFALGLYLENKYILCFFLVVLAMYCHLIEGLFVLLFIGAYFLFKPGSLRKKNILVGIIMSLGLLFPYIYPLVSKNSISSGSIPVAQWVKSTKILCQHWYPITMEMFTKQAHLEFFPFLLICFLFFLTLRHHDISSEKLVKIICGFFACIILTIVGVVFSEFYAVPFIIKLSPQRSTGLITFLGVLFAIHYLVEKVKTSTLKIVLVSCYALIILAFSNPGIAVLPIVFLLGSDIYEGHFGPFKIKAERKRLFRTVYFCTLVLVSLLATVNVLNSEIGILNTLSVHLWKPLRYFDPRNNFDFLVRGGYLKIESLFVIVLLTAVCIGICFIFRAHVKRIWTAVCLLSVIGICLLSSYYIERGEYLRFQERYGAEAEGYMEVQLWAERHTESQSLFMPEPHHYYGWRDFSIRSSFGNVREWGLLSILYISDHEIYLEGLERLKEFGIDMSEENLAALYKAKSRAEVRRRFYDMTMKDFENLSRRYGIDYVVMNKKYQKEKIDGLEIAYENGVYIVYEL
jgi:hypothetical protein